MSLFLDYLCFILGTRVHLLLLIESGLCMCKTRMNCVLFMAYNIIRLVLIVQPIFLYFFPSKFLCYRLIHLQLRIKLFLLFDFFQYQFLQTTKFQSETAYCDVISICFSSMSTIFNKLSKACKVPSLIWFGTTCIIDSWALHLVTQLARSHSAGGWK